MSSLPWAKMRLYCFSQFDHLFKIKQGHLWKLLLEWFCSSLQQDCSPTASPSTAPPAAQQQRTAIHKPFTQSRLPAELPAHPAPRHITTQELQVLESCFHRWRSEVENDIHGKSAVFQPFTPSCLLMAPTCVQSYVCQTSRAASAESTELWSSCTRTNLWCRSVELLLASGAWTPSEVKQVNQHFSMIQWLQSLQLLDS